jgi:hypothetical protein
MRRKPLGYKPPDPKRRNNFLDSCAFDPDCATEAQASLKIFKKYQNEELILHLAHSTQKEIEHPNTPAWVKNEANSFIYTLPTSLTIDEQNTKKRIWEILTGNGKPEKMKKDAEHVFEASKYGGYFITTDARIIKKKQEIESICSVIVVKPTEFLEILIMHGNT